MGTKNVFFSWSEKLSNFAFLYGTFPTAPSVFVYASKYNVLAENIAGSMVVCTFLSAPIMFISGIKNIIIISQKSYWTLMFYSVFQEKLGKDGNIEYGNIDHRKR